MEKKQYIGIILVLTGLLIMLHHFIFWERIADLEDILHHEFFEAVLLTAGITLLISNHFSKRRSKQP